VLGCAQPTPPRWQLGTPLAAAEIARWDGDVRPDGTGLPPGQGDVASGRGLYRARCLACHGERGIGAVAEPLAGRIPGDAFPFALDPSAKRTIGSYWPYATTLFDYVKRAMPLEAPGTLADDEVYALTAYLLYLNDIVDERAVLDQTNLSSVRMPAQGRFVPDDRRGGQELR
jgi:cytochrome c